MASSTSLWPGIAVMSIGKSPVCLQADVTAGGVNASTANFRKGATHHFVIVSDRSKPASCASLLNCAFSGKNTWSAGCKTCVVLGGWAIRMMSWLSQTLQCQQSPDTWHCQQTVCGVGVSSWTCVVLFLSGGTEEICLQLGNQTHFHNTEHWPALQLHMLCLACCLWRQSVVAELFHQQPMSLPQKCAPTLG